ncbi:MAG: hypothetical protein PVG54_15075 [Anaerolineae bacterium]|jgi:signal transduction histidine kinase
MPQELAGRNLVTSDPDKAARGWLAPSGENSPASDLAPSELSVDLAHELRTSLAALTLLSGNLDLLYDRLDDVRRRKMIRDMRRHMHRLNTLVGNILEFDEDPEAPSA